MNSNTNSQFEQERDIFLKALDLPAGKERELFLDQACAGNPQLRSNVVELLRSHTEDSFLENSATLLDPALQGGMVRLSEGPGQEIGRYKLLEKLGEGGFGVVYMADQKEPVKRRVALKIIKLGMDTRQVVARFEAERQALAMMDHPNIARVLDGGSTESGRPYFVMELVRGTPITTYCDMSNLGTKERLELFISVCNAIQHAHQKGIIHRDIKPSNVMVSMHDDKPVVKVIDFGIAKATQAELTGRTVFTQFQQFIGTPAYMSPEQAGFSGLDIDTRSDVYSLGVLLYELLTGKTPLDPNQLKSEDYAEMRRRIQELDAPKPSTRISSLTNDELSVVAGRRSCEPQKLKREIRGDLDWIILKALEKDRTRRYETATAFAEDIRRYLNNEPVKAVAPTAIYLFTKYASRHRTSLAMAAAITLLLVGTATYSAAQAFRASRAAQAAVEAEKLKSIALGSAEQERDRARQLAERLDTANERNKSAAARAEFTTGSHFIEAGQLPKGIAHLARALRTDPNYWPAATRLVSTLTDRSFAMNDLPPIAHDHPIRAHVINRTTGLMATRGEDYQLGIWNGWKAEKLMEIPAIGNRKMPSLSGDGRRMMYVDTNGIAQVFEPFTNPRTPLASLKGDGAIVDAVLSRDKQPGLRAATRLADGRIQLWNAETGIPLGAILKGPSTNGGFLEFTPNGQRLVGSFADGSAGVWSVPPQTEPPLMLQTSTNSVLTLAPDSKTLVERPANNLEIRFWDLNTGKMRGTPHKLTQPLSRVPDPSGTPIVASHGHHFEFNRDGTRMVAVCHGTFTGKELWLRLILHPLMQIHYFDTAGGKLLHSITETNVTHHEENLVAGLSAMVINTNRLVVRSLSNGATLMEKAWPTDAIKTTAFSPAGDRILVALTDRRMILFDTRTGESLTHAGETVHTSNVGGGSGKAAGQTYFMRHGPKLDGLSFSPEGDIFVASYEDDSLQMWDAFEGLPLSDPTPERIGPVIFSTDGRWLLARDVSNKTWPRRVMRRQISAARHRAAAYDGWAPAFHISPDGRHGLVGRNGLLIFNPATGEAIRKIEPSETGNISALQGTTWLQTDAWLSPSGERIAAVCTSDNGNIVKIFETATGKTLNVLTNEFMTQAYRVKFIGETRVVVGSWVYEEGRNPLKIWDLNTGRVIAESKPEVPADTIHVSRDGKRIALTSRGSILLDAKDLRPISGVLNHRASPDLSVFSGAFSPDGSRWVTGATDGTVRVWRSDTGELETEFTYGLSRPEWVSVSPDNRHVAAGGGYYDIPGSTGVWEITNGAARRVTSSLVHSNTVYHTDFTADSRYLLAGDRGGYAQLWDLETSLPILEPIWVDDPGGITRVGVNPQMTHVFAAGRGDSRLHQRRLPPKDIPSPEWLPRLAEAVAGMRVTERGALESLGDAELREAKSLISRLPEGKDAESYYVQWARWLSADPASRGVAPLSSFKVEDEIKELLAKGSIISLRRAHKIAPTDARIFAALARKTAALTQFLPDLPTDQESESGAEWLARQAVERSPGLTEAHWSKAEVLLRRNQTAAARMALSHAMRLEPENPSVLAIQSELERLAGRTNEAHSLMARALNAPKSSPSTAYLDSSSVARHKDFFAEAALRNRTERRLNGRVQNLPPQFIDLTPWFNSSLHPNATNYAKPAPGFPSGVLIRGGIPFDLRGEVILGSDPFSEAKAEHLVGLPIDQLCHQIHFWIGSRAGETAPLRLRVHYADGQKVDSFLRETAKYQWKTVTWENPHPERLVRTIDVITQSGFEPSIGAITVQNRPTPVIATQPAPEFPRVVPGNPLELSVGVKQPGPWTYQWSRGNRPISGATNATFRIGTTTAADLASYSVTVSNPADPAAGTVTSRQVWALDPANPIVRGALKEQLYLNLPVGGLDQLLESPKFPNHPDQETMALGLERGESGLDNFGRRLTGWLMAKETATYIFQLCSDDDSRLSLSSDETAEKLTTVASLSGWANFREWEKTIPEAISQPIRLEAGRRYFIEVLHKDGDQADHLSVAWRKVGDPAPKNGTEPINPDLIGYLPK